jgi:5'-methylthioadenosine phosphorylase
VIDLAIISGTGFYDFPDLEEKEDLRIETRHGDASIRKGAVEGKEIAFIARHGKGHSILPNMINYRANLTALKELRTKTIVATTVCGVLDPSIPLAKLAVFDDLYFPDNRFPDGGACTVYEDIGEKSRGHYIFDKPFSEELRQQLIAAAEDPLKMLRNHASFVSQTAGPEIVLAGELEIPYALLGFGVDYANGVKKEPTPVEELRENLKKSKVAFTNVIRELIKKYSPPKFEGFIYRFE